MAGTAQRVPALFPVGTSHPFANHMETAMKRHVTLCLALMLLAFTARAQDAASPADAPKAPEWGWKHRVVSGLTLTQVAFQDWTQGGENALAYSISLEGSSTLDQETYNWANNYKLAFGQTRLGDQGVRKTDDKIDFESVLAYKLGVYINPYVSATLKTQFAPGFKYDDKGGKTQVSTFFDPAYLTQAIGVGYQPLPELKTRLGAALREVFTRTYNGYADDPATTAVEKTRVEGGLESVTEAEWQLDQNLLFTSKLELFAPFKALDVIVVRSDSKIAAKVSKYVSVILNVQFINDANVSPRTQIKEILGLGLSYQLL